MAKKKGGPGKISKGYGKGRGAKTKKTSTTSNTKYGGYPGGKMPLTGGGK
jgi:hypothetical protein